MRSFSISNKYIIRSSERRIAGATASRLANGEKSYPFQLLSITSSTCIVFYAGAYLILLTLMLKQVVYSKLY